MSRKRSRKRNEDVIKTELDLRRADRDNDDTLEVTDDESFTPPKFTTREVSNYMRSKRRKESHGVRNDHPFPFMNFPPEVRNMIYRYVMVSTSPDPIRLDDIGMRYRPGGIETSILLTNHAVYNEAVKVLYHENKFRVHYSITGHLMGSCCGPYYRLDSPRDATKTQRQLRSGRTIDMVHHEGLIYKDIFYRLRNVEFNIALFDGSILTRDTTVRYTHRFQHLLDMVYNTLVDYSSAELKGLQTTDGNRSLIFHSAGKMGHNTMLNAVKPLMADVIVKAVTDGKLKVVLEGTFPLNWETIFADMKGPGFSADNITAVDNNHLDPENLIDALKAIKF